MASTAPDPARSVGAAGLALAAAAALAVSACGDGPPEEPDGPSASETTAAVPREPRPAPCEVEGYPCTWGEVTPETLRRTDRLGWVAVDIMERTGSLGEVAAFLRGADGVADVWVGDFAVQFRVEGGRPAWIDLPSDPENPRLGGISAGGVRRTPGRSGLPAGRLLEPSPRGAFESRGAATLLQDGGGDGERNGVAADEDRLGEGKRALFLAPVAWHIKPGLGDEIGRLEKLRDYRKDNGAEIVYRANRRKGDVNFGTAPDAERKALDDYGNDRGTVVTLEHFKQWDEFNFVMLETHGKERCPAEASDTDTGSGGDTDAACYTVLNAGQAFVSAEEAAESYADEPGIELTYTFSELDQSLSRKQRKACVDHLSGKTPGIPIREASGVWDGDTIPVYLLEPSQKTCFRRETLDSVTASVTTAFFDAVPAYRDGLDDVVVFLGACESLKASLRADPPADLLELFTGGSDSENVAVFGYDAISNSGWSARIAARLIELMADSALDNREVARKLRREFSTSPLSGVVMADDVAPTDLEAATLRDRSTNPTHGRDVVELVDPLTGEELEDGAGVIALGAPGDGEPDRIRVGMQVRGIDGETDVGAIDVYLRVDGRESEPHELARTIAPHVMRVGQEEADLGFDLGEKETVDLEIRAELEGGGESRWSYDSLKLASWTLSVASPSLAGRYAGFQGFFIDHGGLGQLSLCSAEGPHIQIVAGAKGFDGPGTYVLGNGPDQQEGEVAVSPRNWRGVNRSESRAALRAMKNFITGDGTSVLGQPGGSTFRVPPPSTLRITRVTDEHVEGAITGTFFRQARDGTHELADVTVAFVARRRDPVGGLFSMMRRPGETMCAREPAGPR